MTEDTQPAPVQLAVLISGGGTTMHAILRACSDRLRNVDPVLVIASRSDAGGITKAQAEIGDDRVIVIENKPRDNERFGAEILAACRQYGVDWIGQYGWLPHTPDEVVEAYENRIVNQHPGPLQGRATDLHFGGKGMYGMRVHAARLWFARHTEGNDWTNVVAHHVVPGTGFDEGRLIAVSRVPILPGDCPVALQQRALPHEHEAQISALHLIACSNGAPESFEIPEPIVRPGEEQVFERSKHVAITLFPRG